VTTLERLVALLKPRGYDIASFPVDTPIEKLGLDSLEQLDLLFAVNEEFEVDLPLDKWLEEIEAGGAPITISRIVDYLEVWKEAAP